MRLTTLKLVIIIAFSSLMISEISANNPPNKGRFPAGFWSALRHNPELLKYGDPGWMKKMQLRRELQRSISKGHLEKGLLRVDTFNLPVLLGQYSDSLGILSVQDFEDLLFDNNPTGTMADYYDEVSYGQFNLTGAVYGWFQADQSRSFYTAGNNGFNPNFPANRDGFVVSIVEKADPDVDFGQYDNDGPDGIPNSGDDDGYADAIMIVYAGAGPDWSPGNSNLWPSMSSLGNNEYTTNDLSANGGAIRISTFAVCPERAGGGGGTNQVRPIGVFAHEFGHVLGLPDLYDRTDASESPDFEDSEGIGTWCLMANGSWGGDGGHTETPAHPSAWCKIQMGWVAPAWITENVQGLSVRDAATHPEAYAFWADGFEMSRYFLIENRLQTGFDQYLTGSGLLIFHVDENRRWGRSRWSSGPVNDDETHKMLDLEEADGNADLDNNSNRGDGGDVFPGSNNNRSFTNTSVPNSKDYDGTATGFEISNISDSGPTMTMDVVVRDPQGYGLIYDEEGISGAGWGFDTPQDSWGGVRFTAADAGTLASIDLGFPNSPNTYEIKVYDTFEGGIPSGLLATINGVLATSGWTTIPIEGGAAVLQSNQDFFVSLKIEDRTFAVSFDRSGQNSGRSWFSDDGITFSNSIGTSPFGGDINIRARIKTMDVQTSVSSEDNTNPPVDYLLMQNYPNPFNPETEISFRLANPGNAVVKIYNVEGQEIRALANRHFQAGLHTLNWDSKDSHGNPVSSGVYLFRLQAGEFSKTRKMTILK